MSGFVCLLCLSITFETDTSALVFNIRQRNSSFDGLDQGCPLLGISTRSYVQSPNRLSSVHYGGAQPVLLPEPISTIFFLRLILHSREHSKCRQTNPLRARMTAWLVYEEFQEPCVSGASMSRRNALERDSAIAATMFNNVITGVWNYTPCLSKSWIIL